ncbi:MAG: hypothetical protein KA801_08085 [Syntrophorhabdaceae bacterium]|nr:hypothetical protein [Syntrophorhabdaceae bacterium]
MKAPIFIGRAFFFGVADRHIIEVSLKFTGILSMPESRVVRIPKNTIGEYEV